jgi:mannan endo-1,4-beta-mannosidase
MQLRDKRCARDALLACVFLVALQSISVLDVAAAADDVALRDHFNHFIQVSEDKRSFTLDGKSFFVHGFNQHSMMTHAASNRSLILEVLEDAEMHGFNLMRTWAFNDGYDQWNSLQPFPGIVDEKIFRALDYVLSQCRKHKIRVLLALTNHWEDYGGQKVYYQWSRNDSRLNTTSAEAASDSTFYTNQACKKMYKTYVRTILERRNVYTGVKYKDDEFIFGWDLINEPRVENAGQAGSGILQSWVEEMANYVKSIDTNHLVTSGSEGFFGGSTPLLLKYNPGNWTLEHGVDFVLNHNLPAIDFAVFHLYPDSWFNEGDCDERCALSFTEEYIKAHLNTKILKMPVLLEEFGKEKEGKKSPYEVRNKFIEEVYEWMHEDHVKGGYGAGTVIWGISPANFSDVDSFSIYLDHSDHQSTGQVIRSFGVKVAKRLHSSFQRGVVTIGWVGTIIRNKIKAFMGNRFWKKHILRERDEEAPTAFAASVVNSPNASIYTDNSTAALPKKHPSKDE